MATALSLPDYNPYHMTPLLEYAAPFCVFIGKYPTAESS